MSRYILEDRLNYDDYNASFYELGAALDILLLVLSLPVSLPPQLDHLGL